MSDWEERIEKLERRVRELEDELELRRRICQYGPAVDTGSAEQAGALHSDDCVYDSDGRAPMIGAAGVAEMVAGPNHQSMMPNTAHTMGPSVVRVDGDRAVATGYSRVYLREGDQFKLWRLSANRWEFERQAEEWKISHRTNRLIGTEGATVLLKGALDD